MKYLKTRNHSYHSPNLRRGFFIALLFVSSVAASNIHISGSIQDAESGQSLSNVNVSIPVLNISTISDEQGRYRISPTQSGDYELHFDHIGYAHREKLIQLNPRYSATLHISLQPKSIELPPISVTGRGLSGSLRHTGNQLIIRDITSSDRALRGDIATLLETVPEVTLSRSTPGSAPQISLRGSLSSQVLILLNGIPLRSTVSNQADISQIPLSMIKRIEIAPGNQSAEFGDQAMGGVINIIASDLAAQRSNSLTLGTGSFGTEKYQYSIHLSRGEITAQGALNFQRANNNYPHLFEGELVQRENAQLIKQNLFVSITANPSINTLFQITGISHQDNLGLPGPIYELTPTAQQELNSQTLSSAFLYQPGAWHFATEYSYTTTTQKLEAETGIYPGYKKTYDSKNTHLGLTVSYTHNTNFHLRTKLETNRAWLDGKDLMIPRFSLNEHQRNSTEITASIERVIHIPGLASKLTPHLTIHHYDVEFHDSDDTWNFSLKHGADLDLFLINTWVRTGTAYKLPSFWQMFWVSSAFAEGNPDLLPEHSHDKEAGLRLSLKQWYEPWISITYYKQKYENLITWKRGYGNRFYPVNLQSALVSGLSFSSGLNLLNDQVNLTANHNIVNAINTTPGPNSDGNYLPFRPLGESSVNLDTKVKALLVSVTYREQKRTYIREANTKWLDPFQKLDLACSYTHSFHSLDLLTKIRIDNLTNEQYEVLERFPMPGRYSEINFEIKF